MPDDHAVQLTTIGYCCDMYHVFHVVYVGFVALMLCALQAR
jgi:hypothetical protein